jgi:hypothetical protein
MKRLTVAHRELIRVLAAEAVDDYIENKETNHLLQKETPMERKRKKERDHAHGKKTPSPSVSEFNYNRKTNEFTRYGQPWKPAGIDACVDPVDHEGKLIKASVWLRRQVEQR